MECLNVLTRIDALRTEEIESGDRNEVLAHLETCRSCEESVDDVRAFAEIAPSLRETDRPSVLQQVTNVCFDMFDSFDLDGERVWVAFSGSGLRMIDVAAANEDDFRRRFRARYGRELRHAELPRNLRRSVENSMAGAPAGLDAIDFRGLTSFEREVLSTIRKIPRGEVRPYSWVARAVRKPGASRAVGNVMANNPMPFVLPCHRVVPTSGGVGKYAFGPERKRSLLRSEGAPVDVLDNLARKGIRYVGSATTRIYCFPSCRDARRIREENRVPFTDADAAASEGFRPCRHCCPEGADA